MVESVWIWAYLCIALAVGICLAVFLGNSIKEDLGPSVFLEALIVGFLACMLGVLWPIFCGLMVMGLGGRYVAKRLHLDI